MWRWPFGGPWVPRHGSLNQYGCAVPSSRTKYGLSKFFDAVNILCKSSDVLISWVCRVREYKDLKKLSDPTSISLSGWIFQAEIGLLRGSGFQAHCVARAQYQLHFSVPRRVSCQIRCCSNGAKRGGYLSHFVVHVGGTEAIETETVGSDSGSVISLNCYILDAFHYLH